MEVETPMLQIIPGGATAKPFMTHHNTFDLDMYLRIAPELNLKRLVVGGFDRVFEINRSFRNEGISTRHNPEFTMIEFYQAYADYHDLMNTTEEMLRTIAQDVLGTTTIRNTVKNSDGEVVEEKFYDLGKPFARLSMVDAILQYGKDHRGAEHLMKRCYAIQKTILMQLKPWRKLLVLKKVAHLKYGAQVNTSVKYLKKWLSIY